MNTESDSRSNADTFISHLIELRDRLLRAMAVLLAMFVVLCIWPGPAAIYDFLAQPMIANLPAGSKMIATGVVAPFFIPIKVTLLAAFMLVLPYVLYQAWAFVAPGLYRHERRLAGPILFSSVLLFYTGVAFCYSFVFGNVFKYIAAFAPASIQVAPDIEQYLGFAMTMFLAFGLAFETPIVVIVLVLLGMVSVAKLCEWRGYTAIAIAVISAIVTPPDMFSQLSLGIPMYALYEIGILVGRLIEKKKKAEESPV
ncbi:MAG: twin-arginine translocase subunit TatC [Burkholderiaceae bacterium]|nr:MAG: twin-arginine translocase subunit TatC [Burkholderiaceae bacterium]